MTCKAAGRWAIPAPIVNEDAYRKEYGAEEGTIITDADKGGREEVVKS